MYWLFGILVPLVVGFFFGIAFAFLRIEMTVDQWLALVIVIYLLGAWVGFAIGSRRLHDIGISAWWLLPIFLVGALLGALEYLRAAQIIGLIWTVILGSIPGNRGANKYGADPKGMATSIAEGNA